VPVFEEWLLSSVKAGHWTRSFDGFAEVVNRRGHEFLDAIQPLMQTAPRANAHVAADVLAALSTTLDRQVQKAYIVTLIQEYWPILGEDNRRTIALALEGAVSGRSGDGLLDSTVAALSVWMVRQPEHLRADEMTYVVFAAAQSDDRRLADAAIEWLKRTVDIETVSRALVYQGPKRLPFVPGWRMVRDAAQRIDGMRDGPSLMNAICNSRNDWQEQVLQWLSDPMLSVDAGYMLRELKERILADPAKELFWSAVEVRDSAER
jgi:hypothetical protein